MSSTTPAPAGPAVDEHDAELAREVAVEVRHAHPSDMTYIVVALVLGVITAIEVGIYYINGSDVKVAGLLVLMAIKFVIVAAFFMHLRFDSKYFRRLFILGVALAVAVYSAVLFIFGIFHL
jgi:cytochrome c oxidase subunit 4